MQRSSFWTDNVLTAAPCLTLIVPHAFGLLPQDLHMVLAQWYGELACSTCSEAWHMFAGRRL